MYNIERITKIIKDIVEYQRLLKSFKINSINDLNESKTLHSSAMIIFAMLNRVIDLCQEILIKEEYGMPSRYGEIFNKLEKAGIINKKESQEFEELMKFRNAIAHTYYDMTKNDVFKILQKIKLISELVEKVKKRIKIKNGEYK